MQASEMKRHVLLLVAGLQALAASAAEPLADGFAFPPAQTKPG